jgi:hypothetical protein
MDGTGGLTATTGGRIPGCAAAQLQCERREQHIPSSSGLFLSRDGNSISSFSEADMPLFACKSCHDRREKETYTQERICPILFSFPCFDVKNVCYTTELDTHGNLRTKTGVV